DPNENAGSGVGAAIEALEQVELSRDLAPLPRPRKGVLRQSATDPDARFLRARGGRFVLGYTGEIAVSEDHLIVAQRVTAQSTDNASLVPMVELVKTSCSLAARACDRRQRVLLQPQRRTDGSAGHRCLCAGLEPGPGTESWTRPSLPRSEIAPHAREDALRAGQAPLPQAQSHRRTGL